MKLFRDALPRAAALGLTVLLCACGGGGGGGSKGDVAVDFGYGLGQAYLYQATTLAIQGTNLQGLSLHCSLTGGSLPAGLALQSNGCAITGTPTEAAVKLVNIRLTAEGYSGHVEQEVRIESVGPALSYVILNPKVLGEVVSYKPQSSATPAWTPGAGVSIAYSIGAGSLPPGLSIDTVTGEISGIVVSFDEPEFTVAATVTGPQGSTTALAPPDSMPVANGGLQFFHAPNDFPMFEPAGSALSLTPLFAFGSRLDSSRYSFSNFRVAPGSTLPAGWTLDASSGLLLGTVPSPAGQQVQVSFLVDITSEGKTATFASQVMVLNSI